MSRGYHSYRGRASGKKIALVIVLVILLLLSGALFFLQNHLVYHSDGSVTLELPFFSQKEEDTTQPLDTEDEEPPKTPIEILPSDEELIWDAPLKGESLNATELTEDTYPALAAEDYTGAVIEMKGFNGTYYYLSQYAKEKALDPQAVTMLQVESALSTRGNLNAVAAIGCFHDSFAAYSDMTGAGICQKSGYIWYDDLRSHWMDPAKEGTAAYMTDVIRECLDLGFQEILLTDFTYPTQGDLSQIDYSYHQYPKSEYLQQFLLQLQETLGETRISLSYTQEQLISGQNSTSGISIKAFLPYIHRLFITEVTDLDAVKEAILTAGGEDALNRTVVRMEGSTLYQK